jgi:hypothetical protein
MVESPSKINDVAIAELANIISAPASAFPRFADNMRETERAFAHAVTKANVRAIREHAKRLWRLCEAVEQRGGDQAADALACALETLSAEVKSTLLYARAEDVSLPLPSAIRNRSTRAGAVVQLRRAVSVGGQMVAGRKRPGGKQSKPTFRPELWVPTSPQGKPKDMAQRELIQNLALAYAEATGRETPRTVNYEPTQRGPFSTYVHRFFALLGESTGNVTDLINQRGQLRPKDDPEPVT